MMDIVGNRSLDGDYYNVLFGSLVFHTLNNLKRRSFLRLSLISFQLSNCVVLGQWVGLEVLLGSKDGFFFHLILLMALYSDIFDSTIYLLNMMSELTLFYGVERLPTNPC